MTDSNAAADPAALVAYVAELLRAERVEIVPLPNAPAHVPLIVTIFAVEDQRVPVLVFPNTARDYLILLGLVMSPSGELPEALLDALSAEKLRGIIRAQDKTPLAKADYTEPGDGRGVWSAISHCSTREMTGIKIRRRLEDTAKLTRRLWQILLAPEPSSPPTS